MTTLNSENVRKELTRVETEAKQAFADANKLKEAMVAEGVNPLTDKEAFQKVDDAFKAYSVLAEKVTELEGMLARLTEIDGLSARPSGQRPDHGRALELVGSGLPERLSIGSRFVKSQQYEAMHKAGAFKSDAGFRAQMARGFDEPVTVMERDELEAGLRGIKYGATTVTGGGATSAGPFIMNDLVAGFVEYFRKRPTIAAIVGQGTTDSDVVEYVTQSAPTNAAVETAEDVAAPESTYPFATVTTNVREITHFVPVTNRAMADHGQIRTIVENELALDVLDRLDSQAYAGDGAGQNLQGIITAVTQAQALGADSRADASHKAATLVRIAAGVLMEPDYYVFHPSDWQDIRLEKGTDGHYFLGQPVVSGEKVLWGTPVIVSTVATAGVGLVGNFERGARLWLREGLAVTTGLDGNDFTKRRVSILAAMRVAFATVRPTAFAEITGI